MKKWFKRKPKVVKMQMGDYLDISIVIGGVKHYLELTQIDCDLRSGATVTFTDRQQHLFGNFVN